MNRDHNRTAYVRRDGDKKTRVADLMAAGISTTSIADRLGISRKSVNARISEIRKELGWQAQ